MTEGVVYRGVGGRRYFSMGVAWRVHADRARAKLVTSWLEAAHVEPRDRAAVLALVVRHRGGDFKAPSTLDGLAVVSLDR